MFAVVYSFNFFSSLISKFFILNNNNNQSVKFNNLNSKNFKLIYELSQNNKNNFKNRSIFFVILINNFYYCNFLFFFLTNRFDLKPYNFSFIKNNQNFSFLTTKRTLHSFFFLPSNIAYKQNNNENYKSNDYSNVILKFFSSISFFKHLKIISNYKIKFSVSDFFKNLNGKTLNYMNILFLRKNKVFNKGRYSRNRQYYRTGVYWCLYINIIAVIGIYFWFYRFNMNFGYLWWLLYAFICSFAFSRAMSYNLINIKNLFFQILNSFTWFFNIIFSFVSNIFLFLKSFLKSISSII